MTADRDIADRVERVETVVFGDQRLSLRGLMDMLAENQRMISANQAAIAEINQRAREDRIARETLERASREQWDRLLLYAKIAGALLALLSALNILLQVVGAAGAAGALP